jgi:cyclopropane fatty-acyl-phospholipid synthase-like methyltransferase
MFMKKENTSITKATLNAQQEHWEKMFTVNTEMFGAEPSLPARRAAELFKKEGGRTILELGGGQGRDTLYFAREGLHVHALDYSREGVETIKVKADALGTSQSVTALQYDVRQPLPFDAEVFDGCYSHMLYCMALTTGQLEFISKEIWRTLKPGGLNIYTVRNTTDAHYQTGTHRGEDMWEIGGGFIVHFFSREKVKGLAKGYEIVDIEEFEEGELPKKLFLVTLRKSLQTQICQ